MSKGNAGEENSRPIVSIHMHRFISAHGLPEETSSNLLRTKQSVKSWYKPRAMALYRDSDPVVWFLGAPTQRGL